MYYEWYIDLFFLENVIMDGILLILVGIAMNLRHSALRLLLAAAEGGEEPVFWHCFRWKTGQQRCFCKEGWQP